MLLRLLAASVVVLLPGPVVLAASDPYLDLQNGAAAFGEILPQDAADQAQDQADVTTDAGDAFFAEPNASSSSEHSSTEPFVTFLYGTKSYALTDVPLSAWFAPYVRDVAGRGIVSGYRDAQGVPTGIFAPARDVSMEELAKMAIEASKIDTTSCPSEASNAMAAGRWSQGYIACAESHQFAAYADSSLDLTRPATRAEVVMTVLQAFGASFVDAPPAGVSLSDVTDATLFSAAIYTALRDGIVSGYADANGTPTGLFGPANAVNRAEVSKIISLAVQVYGQ